VIPLWNFFRVLNDTGGPTSRRIYVRSDGVWAFHSIMRVLSYHPMTVIDVVNPSVVMRRGVVGIEKLERDVRAHRGYVESITFEYNIDRSTAAGLREAVLTSLGIPLDASGRPSVLLVNRGNIMRDIVNKEDLHRLMAESCPECDVQLVALHRISVEEQIERASRASVIVGLHGSGLAHAIWMREGTHLVEIVPHMYTCRNWYQIAAAAAGLTYHKVMNKRPPNTTADPVLERCVRNRACASHPCHDVLRDQPVTVEVDTFAEVWRVIVGDLKAAAAQNSSQGKP
jgi:hypothetical protein